MAPRSSIWSILIVFNISVPIKRLCCPNRCADLISEVVKVLQRVGVSCCTIQPEFASRSCPSVIQREDVSGTHRQTCRLACTDACAANMCCSPSEKKKLPSCSNTQLMDQGSWAVNPKGHSVVACKCVCVPHQAYYSHLTITTAVEALK